MKLPFRGVGALKLADWLQGWYGLFRTCHDVGQPCIEGGTTRHFEGDVDVGGELAFDMRTAPYAALVKCRVVFWNWYNQIGGQRRQFSGERVGSVAR